MTGNYLDSEQMVPVPALNNSKPIYVEQATVAAENSKIEDIIGVYPKIAGVNTTEMKNSVDDLPIITDNEGSNTENEINKEGDYTSKGGD